MARRRHAVDDDEQPMGPVLEDTDRLALGWDEQTLAEALKWQRRRAVDFELGAPAVSKCANSHLFDERRGVGLIRLRRRDRDLAAD